MAKKLSAVEVTWKYTVETGANTLDVRFPRVTFAGDDLKKRTRFSDLQWTQLAHKEFERQKGFNTGMKDVFVRRIFAA